MKRKSLLVLFFKVFVFVGVLAQGVYLFIYKPDVGSRLKQLFVVDLDTKFILAVFILMFLNWSLEAIKWRFIVEWVKRITFLQSLKTVLLGLAFSFFTPRGIGEYFARAYTLDVKKKLPIVLSLLMARMSQLLVLVVGGVCGGVVLFQRNSIPMEYMSLELDKLKIGIVGLILSIGVVMFLILRYNVKVKQVLKLLQKSGLLSVVVISCVTGLSLVRYLTYCTQFTLLVLAFGVEEVSIQLLFGAVMFTFLMKSLVPVFNFMSDLGVREVFAVVFLSMAGIPAEVALGASLLLWFINIVLPTIVGAMLVFKTKVTW